jgi:hypothetical protein
VKKVVKEKAPAQVTGGAEFRYENSVWPVFFSIFLAAQIRLALISAELVASIGKHAMLGGLPMISR